MEKLIPTLIRISATLLGIVFVFSGFVKGVDPMGSAFKFSDYFNAFNLGFLSFFGIVLAFVMSAAEFLIGVSLIFRLRFRLGIWAVSVFMGFFTLLTFILALTNPVTDCGCFGDAIIMSNWQTFIKNLVLLPFVAVLFLNRSRLGDPWKAGLAWSGILLFAFLFTMLQLNALRHPPMLDFRPYSVGTYIPSKMSIPEGAPLDVYETVLYYEKDGNVEAFNEDNFPWDDSTWTYVDSEHKRIRKGYEPPIHDFTISDEFGYDHTNDILADGGYTFLMISRNIKKADPEALLYADELNAWLMAGGHSFFLMTASTTDEIESVREELGLEMEFYTTDEITLKTIVRSNPGLLLLQEGTILAKWHFNDFPGLSELQEGIGPTVMGLYRTALEKRAIFIFLVLFILISGLITFSPITSRNTG